MSSSLPPHGSTSTLDPVPEPVPQHRPRKLGRLLAVALLIAGAGVVAVLSREEDPKPRPGFAIRDLTVEPRTSLPSQSTALDPANLSAVASKLDIPERMLRAYVNAEESTRRSTPRCGMSWTMLAGIGRIESRHGRFGGATVGQDGQLSQPIIGVPLDGSPGLKAIKDTDKGVLDRDPEWDRAVGPMQFLPVTWARWAVRASGDGARPDPQNVDDAVLSAARYLCASGGDVGSPRGWWSAVLTYNNSVKYGRDVFSGQDAFARATNAS